MYVYLLQWLFYVRLQQILYEILTYMKVVEEVNKGKIVMTVSNCGVQRFTLLNQIIGNNPKRVALISQTVFFNMNKICLSSGSS